MEAYKVTGESCCVLFPVFYWRIFENVLLVYFIEVFLSRDSWVPCLPQRQTQLSPHKLATIFLPGSTTPPPPYYTMLPPDPPLHCPNASLLLVHWPWIEVSNQTSKIGKRRRPLNLYSVNFLASWLQSSIRFILLHAEGWERGRHGNVVASRGTSTMCSYLVRSKCA